MRKIRNSVVRRISSDDGPWTPYAEPRLTKQSAKRRFRTYASSNPYPFLSAVMSLRAALRQKNVRPKPARQETMRVTKHLSSDSSGSVPVFQSLRDALTQESGRVKGTDPESLQLSPSGQIENASVLPKAPKGRVRTARAPPKAPKGKVRKVRAAPKSFIETANASDLEILRKFKPGVQHQY